MPSSATFNDIIEEIRADKDVKKRLQDIFGRSQKQLSRAERLQFTLLILQEVTFSTSKNAHNAFLQSIESLRGLLPHLKTKGESMLSKKANIEARAVNHAAAVLLADGPVDDELRSSATDLVEGSLRTIFNAIRVSTRAKASNKSGGRRKHDTLSATKENCNPQLPGDTPQSLCEAALDDMVFRGASALGLEQCLPNNDAMTEAKVVSRALSVKLTAMSYSVPLAQLYMCSKMLILPWVRYCREPSDSSEKQYQRNVKAVQKVLFGAAQAQDSDPVTALRVRAYALTLGEPSLKTYARELLRCAQCFTRSDGNHRPSIVDAVGSVYDDALQFVSKFDSSNAHWFAEDVSAWMDHLAVIWSRRTKRLPLPMIFERRIGSLKKEKEKNGLLAVHKLQVHLVQEGLYAYNYGAAPHSNKLVLVGEALESIEKPLSQLKVPSLTSLSKGGGKSKSRRLAFCTMERIGLNRLRVLRVLEPLCKSILALAANSIELPCGAILALEVFLSAITSGLVETNADHSKVSPEEAKTLADIRTCLHRMVGVAFEVTAGLSRIHFRAHREENLVQIVRAVGVFLDIYFEDFNENARKRRDWLCHKFRAELLHVLTHARGLPRIDRLGAISTVSTVADECERTWFADQIRNESFQRTRFELLETVRSCSVLLKDWANVAEASIRKVMLAMKTQENVREKTEDEFLVSCHDFAKDIARLFDDDDSPAICVEPECLPEFLLAVVMDYCAVVTTQLAKGSSNEHEHYKALGNLAEARTFLLEEVETNSLDGLCPQRKLHQMWLSLCLKGSNQETEISGPGLPDRLADRTKLSCRHCTRGLRSFSRESVPCSEDHLVYSETLYNILKETLKGDMGAVRDSLKEVKSALMQSKSLSGDTELMTLSFEIFCYVQHVAALKDVYDVSTEALAALRSCQPLIVDSEPHTSVGSFCFHLASLCSHENFWTIPAASLRRASNPTTLNRSREHAGCGGTEHADKQPAGIHELITEMDAATRDLKNSLRPLMNDRPLRRSRMTSISCHIAGVDVDVAYNILIHLGQHRILDLLFLTESLYRVARLFLLIENIADGRYYLERCVHVASLCLPSENTFLRTVSKIASVGCKSDPPAEDSSRPHHARSLQETIPEGKDPRLEFIMRQAVANALLDKRSKRCTFHVDDNASAEILRQYQVCERIMDQMDVEDYELSAAELNLSRGLAYSSTGNYSKAMKHLRAFNHEYSTTPKVLRGIGLYFLAKAIVSSGFDAATDSNVSTRACTKARKRNTSKRFTRSQSRSLRGECGATDPECGDVLDMLKRALKETGNTASCPRLNRRVWTLKGFSAGCIQESVAELRKAVGCTFDIRWRAARHGKETCSPTGPQGSHPASDLWNSSGGKQISEGRDCVPTSFLESLGQAKCVVLGLNIDDARENLQVWRLSSNGVMSKRLQLPTASDMSFSGITDRMADIFLEMKSMLVKPGDSFSTEEKLKWWTHRHQLDDEMRQLVTDIEEQWLGEFKGLLLPCIFRGDFLEENDFSDGDAASFSKLAESATKFHIAGSTESESGNQDKSRRIRKKQSVADLEMGTLCLVLDTALEQIPWESLPFLRDVEVSVCRVPSLSYLDFHLQQKAVIVPREDVLYVVNPGGDLRRTENTFRAHGAFESWTGFYGKTSAGEVREAYQNQSVYLYSGHGTGEQYLSPRKFCKNGKAPIALLMGCSSARASNVDVGDCESNGSWIDYLIQDSPAVVGNCGMSVIRILIA